MDYVSLDEVVKKLRLEDEIPQLETPLSQMN